MAAAFLHSALPEGHFRLLKLFANDDQLVGELHHYLMNQCPRYSALSYCWGTEEATEVLTCNSAPFGVSPTLGAAQRSLSNKPVGESVLIWIGAICINQADNVEKSTQVRMMGSI